MEHGMSESPKLDATAAFERLGQITRQLHQAMSELGLDNHLHRIVNEIPDARERLTYVAQMTESAAHKVLGLVDAAQPACSALREQAVAQRAALAPLLDSTEGPVREALQGALALADAAEKTADQQYGTLTEIMMSQDFQDLSGQVIKKVIDIISQTETQLLQLLSQSAPEHLAAAAAAANEQLQGPQTPEKALKQDDVDDLLSSLGF
jgi:chemotaxis protein CheZ